MLGLFDVAWGSNFLPEPPDGFLPWPRDVLRQYAAFYQRELMNQDRMDAVIQAHITREIRVQNIRGQYEINLGAICPFGFPMCPCYHVLGSVIAHQCICKL